MSQMPSVVAVKKLYTQSFMDLVEFRDKIMNANDEEDFAVLVEAIYNRVSTPYDDAA
jgi:hypothetical protein